MPTDPVSAIIPLAPGERLGRLALQDGSVFYGKAFGATGRGIAQFAEVVFNTAMCGYQEALTDPSYTGQMLVMTYPMMGNYGVNLEDVESKKVQVAGFVVRELAQLHSNYRSTTDLSDYLKRSGVLGLFGIDTRALTRRLRTAGVMQGVITDEPVEKLPDAELIRRAQQAPKMEGQNLVPLVGCTSKQTWAETLGDWSLTKQLSGVFGDGAPAVATSSSGTNGAVHAPAVRSTKRFRVLALDCGAKANILRNLADRHCDVTVVPHDISAAEITGRFQRGEADGLFISNGPGDPAAVEATIKTLREIIVGGGGTGKNAMTIPTFGICLGHQLLGLAIGAKTFKLKFGHRGANQPVKNLLTGKVEITSQNHGFAVDPESLKNVGGEATHVHLNDGTLAGFRLKDKPVFCVQYHPEASPGPHDSAYLFDAFVQMMADRKPTTFQ